MAKTLVMSFINAAGKKTSITVNNVKDSLTAAEVSTAMDTIVEKNIFNTTGGDIKSKDSASISEKTTEELTVK